ncbi:MAG: dihydroorotase [Sphingomonadaceae bacterium]
MSVDHVDTIVRGGKVVHSSGVTEAAVAIADGKIVAIASEELLPPATTHLDASGKYVLPGLVDVHTHVYLDSYRTISESAAFGGVTTLLSYIWPDQDQDIPASIDHWRRFGEAASVVDFGLHMGLMDSPSALEQIPASVEMGVTSFKLMMDYKRRGLMVSDEFMMAAMERIAEAGGLATVHAENGGVIHHLEEKMAAEGFTSPADYPRSRPREAEVEAVNRAISIAGLAGCPLYLVHITTSGSVDAVAGAHLSGQPVWAEACPHYFFLTEEEFERQGPIIKVAPPLRAAEDCQALWTGLDRNVIATVASDHTAYTREMKEAGWTNIFQAPFGVPGTETMLSLMHTEAVVKRGLPITILPRLLSENPAKLFGLYPRKGVLEVGSDADLAIFDPDREVTITGSILHTKADFTPFEGRKVRGWVTSTLVRGQPVVLEGRLAELPPHGVFLERKPYSTIEV